MMDEYYEDATQWWKDDRFLAVKTAARMDYSVLAVTVMTLGLILIVEVCKHQLDHAAHGRPFFRKVLETFYTELTILGFVEFIVWLVQSYYKDYNKDQKAVFAMVHFGLFYTALFTAFQSALVAFCATRVSNNLWVRTEALELNHYVEIREEFDRVSAELKSIEYKPEEKDKASLGEVLVDDLDVDDLAKIRAQKQDDISMEEGETTGKYICKNLFNLVRHPFLQHKHHQLLVKVRFHELRVHFLQAYDLPLKFKVSDYLMRSQLKVLFGLVSVSAFGWLFLAGAANLLYFILGIAVYYTENIELGGTALVWIVVGALALYVVIAIVIYNKVQRIFTSIMHQEQLWDMHNGKHEELMAEQLKLFWFSKPKVVLASIQFMNFGYAIALSAVIIFWDTLGEADVTAPWFFLMIGISYSVFLFVVAKVIPLYTLCRSLGQLVDKKRLQETLATFRLEEAKRFELQKSERPPVAHDWLNDGNKDSVQTSQAFPSAMAYSRSFASNNSVTVSLSQRTDASVSSDQETAEIMAELVKLDTSSLRTALPESEKEALKLREQLKSSRKKSVSDGVASMARSAQKSNKVVRYKDDWDVRNGQLVETTDEIADTKADLRPDDTTPKSLRDRRSRVRRMKSVSDGVALMRATALPRVPEPVPEEIYEEEENHGPAEQDEKGSDDSDGSAEKPFAGQSSTDDIAQYEYEPRAVDPDYHHVTLRQRLQRYYLSKRFVLFSNVFGTMVAFFMAGQRVAGFLQSEGIIYTSKYVDFAFRLSITFWFLFVWLVLFLMTSTLIFYSVGCVGPLENKRERQVRAGAALDVIISGTCLIVLCVAEAERCCSSDSDPSVDLCSCSTFGSREYGGLGTIEPYTSLVALRVFRHWVAKWITSRNAENKGYGQETLRENLATIRNPFEVVESSHSHTDHSPSMRDERGTLTELWQMGVARYPDIVAKHGEFSEELLRAMLGIVSTTTMTDTESDLMDSSHGESIFSYPGARLILSMQRCERKLLPFVETWCTVDIVMTTKEIVYFDVIGTANEVLPEGGKGLRLCDVANRRRVVGHLELSDVESIHVERELLHDITTEEFVGPDKEDKVKIRSTDGSTLCLKFSEEMHDAEAVGVHRAADVEIAGPALQWAQAVVRCCGPGQLKQPLPHYGDEASEELRDVLVVKHHGHHGDDGFRILSRAIPTTLFRRDSIRRTRAGDETTEAHVADDI